MAISNSNYELSIIKILIEGKSPELLVRLTPEYFGNKDVGNLFRVIKNFYIDHGQFLGYDALKAELESRVRDADKCKFLSGLVDDTKERDISGLTESYLMDELRKQKQFRAAISGVGAVVDAVDKKDANSVIGSVQSLYENMFADSVSESLASADMVAMTGKKVEFQFIRTSLAQLDIYGGLIESGLSMILAESGRGKTHMATQWAKYHHDNYEGSTLVASWEQGASELRARILSNASEVDLGTVTLGKYTDEELLKIRLAEVRHLCGPDEEVLEFARRTYKLPDKDFWENIWTSYEPQKNRFYLLDTAPDWDTLFVTMEMMVQSRGVRFIVLDYPEIISRPSSGASQPRWEFALNMIGKLKAFCRRHNVRIVFPAQWSESADHIRYNSGAINFVDLAVALAESDEDKEYGTYTVQFKKYRNFIAPVGGGTPQDFKVLKRLNVAKFEDFNF